jgi:hypothetical protein
VWFLDGAGSGVDIAKLLENQKDAQILQDFFRRLTRQSF